MTRFLPLAAVLPVTAAHAAPPPGTDPNSPMRAWWEGANNAECYPCCGIGDGHVVRARPEPDSPEGWAVEFNGRWVPIPAGTRAVRCGDDGKPVEPYPPHPSGSAVIWEYPAGTIRCWIPPEGSG